MQRSAEHFHRRTIHCITLKRNNGRASQGSKSCAQKCSIARGGKSHLRSAHSLNITLHRSLSNRKNQYITTKSSIMQPERCSPNITGANRNVLRSTRSLLKHHTTSHNTTPYRVTPISQSCGHEGVRPIANGSHLYLLRSTRAVNTTLHSTVNTPERLVTPVKKSMV